MEYSLLEWKETEEQGGGMGLSRIGFEGIEGCDFPHDDPADLLMDEGTPAEVPLALD